MLVLPHHRQAGVGCRLVGQLQVTFDRRQLPLQLFDQGQEVVMHQHQVILGVVHGEEHLLRRQANVHGVQYRADHRHGKETLQVAVAVPVEQGHGVPGLDAGGGQGVGQAADPLIEGLVAVAQFVGVDDFPPWLVAHPGQQQLLDQQRIGIGAGGRWNDFCRDHAGVPCPFNQNCAAGSSYRQALPALTEALNEWMRGNRRAK
ncbi:hypothetical protein D3C81_1472780 [compost metagenome]